MAVNKQPCMHARGLMQYMQAMSCRRCCVPWLLAAAAHACMIGRMDVHAAGHRNGRQLELMALQHFETPVADSRMPGVHLVWLGSNLTVSAGRA